MKNRDADILILPGIGGGLSDVPGATTIWYRRWHEKLATASIIEQSDWDNPVADEWAANLMTALEAANRPVILIGHSGGVMTVAHAFAGKAEPAGVAGAFLVTPPELEATVESVPSAQTFRPRPSAPLPFPSMMIASRTDPYCSFEAAGEMALDWGSVLHDSGESDHINIDSGHGPWPEGLLMFSRFIGTL